MLRTVLAAVAICAASAPALARPVYFDGEPLGVGDPNPFFEHGTYSVFYLRNQGHHPWWLAQTRDLATWSKPEEMVSVGGPGSPDIWTGSGSVIVDPAGGYRLFYTGHDPAGMPREMVMSARAEDLSGPWIKSPQPGFSGPPQYDAGDFRDPFVFWNRETESYWMLLATRFQGKAVIGRYTSRDLATWQPETPLYMEASPLNLECPDLFEDGGRWFLLYSDQRDTSRQVRYLAADRSTGPYAHDRYDALDGRAFYAGKSAGPRGHRLLFGWLADKVGHDDANDFSWGGDLIAHAIRRAPDGSLAVSLPASTARRFVVQRKTVSAVAPDIGRVVDPLLVEASLRVPPGDRFGVRFDGQPAAMLTIDTKSGVAEFRIGNSDRSVASVRFPARPDGKYALKLLLDPDRKLGILYIDDYRALSFRYYRLPTARLQFVSTMGFVQLSGRVRSLKAPQPVHADSLAGQPNAHGQGVSTSQDRSPGVIRR